MVGPIENILMDDDQILASTVVRSTMNPEKTGLLALEAALKKAGLRSSVLGRISFLPEDAPKMKP